MSSNVDRKPLTKEPLYLGIDAGGTGCRARLVDAHGRVLGEASAGPATLRLGAATASARMMEAAGAACAAAGVATGTHAIHLGVGVAGIGRIGAAEALAAIAHPFASRAIASDQVAACLGAHGGGDGGIVIAGTGSAAYARLGGAEIRCGGYGFPVSDEGSGARLGLAAVQLALRAHDGRAAMTPALAALLGRFDGDPYRIVAWMETATATHYAELAPLVCRYAESGDSAADRLVAAAAADISALMRALADRGVARVALIGGLAPVLMPRLDADARATLVVPLGDALDGALCLAGFRAARR